MNMNCRGFQHLQPDAAIEELGYVHIPKKTMDESCFRGNYNLQQLTDIFSLPEMMLLANVMELLNLKEIDYDPPTIFKDVEQAVREVHVESNHEFAIDS